ncbi:T9SS type A sorting domain-containing protein [Hymenobacter gummosus]|uniref:T9SS type A sorting domain-containing protein n=1 Tax=Hymenobacter gummosus TaxID=1776032 RepID=A0A431TV08_9BACT|nr:two-component regulator propeller domain-containing protein [Hymenobacter gummosus]RTQ44979.1 T9SS type A sorting domain-containing protein [Hymenobacter gummosus]
MTQALRSALLLAFTLLAGILSASAQRTAAYGDWQLHLPTNRSRTLADAGDRIFVAAEDAFYVFDKQTTSIQRLSRRDGLNDVDVDALAFDSLTQQVVVVYRSGTIDLLSPEGRVVGTLSDIKRKAIVGKTINSVSVARRLAYVNTNFGIVVVDLQRREVRDTYSNIGAGGVVAETFATTVLGDSLYAATSSGLLRGRLTDNLLNYQNWRVSPSYGPRPGNPYRWLVTHQGKVYAGMFGDNVLRAVGNNWVRIGFYTPDVRGLRSSAAGLIINELQRVTILDTRTNTVRQQVQNHPKMPIPLDASRSRSGPLYVADFTNGLLRIEGQNVESFVANGPASVQAFNILPDAASKTVTVFSGGYGSNYAQNGYQDGFYVFDENGRWTNYNSQNYSATDFPNFRDFSRGVRTPDGTLYAASYGFGLLEWKGPGQWKQYTYGMPGVPLRTANSGGDPEYTRLTDAATDPSGNVWVVNRSFDRGGPGLFRFTPSTGEWQSGPTFAGSDNLERLAIDDLGHLWVARALALNPGVVAYNPETAALRNLNSTDGLPNSSVRDIVKDRRGAIWAATNVGVAVYDDPSSAFTPDAAGFRTPIVRRGAGSGYAALSTEVVRCVAVDGANRKWFGTDNGLWLFNEDADEGLLYFTTDNSPLPSNRIVDVAVDDRTGEVWVATEAGLVSYRGSATVTEGTPTAKSCAKVFPNPVRQDFSGQVGISGLANNAEVKITDVSGKLVYQTRATGGTVVWNLADYNGRRVQSGVYLVLSADADGKNGCISKVAVLTK